MENPINITMLNDFVFCPLSIYYHNLYDAIDTKLYQNHFQIDGTNAHAAVDNNKYSTSAYIMQGMSVYCEKYNLIGKIDIFNSKSKTLIERKKKIKTVYDGYVFQLYAQYFALIEMGFEVKILQLYSMDDNKKNDMDLPQNNPVLFHKFEKVLFDIDNFDFDKFVQTNALKCRNCIYEPYCDRSVL